MTGGSQLKNQLISGTAWQFYVYTLIGNKYMLIKLCSITEKWFEEIQTNEVKNTNETKNIYNTYCFYNLT